MNNGETRSLYWAGTYVAPTTADQSYSWVSENDKEKTSAALLAAGGSTKDFTYENNQISYSASALGSITIVKMERV